MDREKRMGIEKAERGGITLDTTANDTVRDYFEFSFENRVFNPTRSAFESEELRSQVQDWKLAGKTVVFTSGVYDLFHANQRTYLLHTKVAAAQRIWQRESRETGGQFEDWATLPADSRDKFTREFLGQDKIKLVVSVDGNMAVAERKGHKAEKGGMPRPFYDWDTRARDILSIGYELSTGDFRPIVDAVTIHDRVLPDLADTPHSGIMEIADFIEPDVWSIYHESQDIIAALGSTHGYMLERGMSAIILAGKDYYEDALLGGPFKTTAIAQRIGNAAVGNQ